MWGMQDKVVVITGAAHGIGRATAAVFSAEGAVVVLADVEHAAAQEAARAIKANAGNACAIACDVSQGESVRRMVQLVVEQFGRIDVLHANAAVQVNKEALETTEEEWDKMHGVNLRGVFLTCKHVIPVMRRQKKGA